MLLRHAKSAWPPGIADHDRPLAPRGQQAAPLLGRFMAREGLLPDLVLVSTARRTQETWALLRAAWTAHPAAKAEPRLYDAAAPDVLHLVQSCADQVRTLLLIGHNPSFADLARALSGAERSDQDAMQRLATKFPTAALAVIDTADSKWSGVMLQRGTLRSYTTPRQLGGVDED
jgi:phosphohistidine phosphatase